MDLVCRARTQTVTQSAVACGAELVGIAPAEAPPRFDAYRQAIELGWHGEMGYLARSDAMAKRAEPALLLPGARSIVCLAFAYGDGRDDPPAGAGEGRIARYARNVDYHELLPERLAPLLETIRELGGEARLCVDSAAVCEVAHAARAGLGWIGKHTLLLHPRRGSWLLLAEVLTTLELAFDEPLPDRCGNCTRCLDACPTAAFPAPYRLDARRCLSYLTIELRDAVPEQLRGEVAEWLFGCDICQEVCPYNQRFAAPAALPELRGGRLPATLPLAELAELDEESFRRAFGGTALWRTKRRGLLRTVCLLLAGRGDEPSRAVLARLVHDAEPIVREHAAWALGGDAEG